MIYTALIAPPPSGALLPCVAVVLVLAIVRSLQQKRRLRRHARIAWLRTEHALRISGRPARPTPRSLALESDGRGSI